jgi:UDP-N-acetylmuramoyl-L-alanyl-D-glutamate--2,6-diaminopimelate ligase
VADVPSPTSDNPRSEDPAASPAEVMVGVASVGPTGTDGPGPDDAAAPGTPTDRVERIEDRRAAIERAIALAGPRDIVLITGKGHEQGQRFADRTVPFDDRVVAREALVALAASGPAGGTADA